MASPDLPAAGAQRRDDPAPAVPRQGGPGTRPGGEVPARKLLLDYLQEQLKELLREQERVQAGEADAIHKMRVSTRRLRSALASYRRLLSPEPARFLRSELKWLAQVLGAARDAQVMRHRLQDLVASQPPELVLGSVSARIDEVLLADYNAALRTISKELAGERYHRAVEGLQALAADPGWTEAGQDRSTAGRMIRKDRARLRSRVRQARREHDREARAEILHEARKDAKRLRYAAETWRPAGGQAAEAMVDAAEALQKILGEHQDSVVARALLRRLGSTAGSGEDGFTYGRLHAIEEGRADAAEKQFRRLWKDFPKLP
ncbi:CHAD domain-containing protein [Arthrobacter sp. Sa2BUA2]|uniref:CHAD domain-containing protein n=1 Tax=Arthrobacter pullicola TaxID=2762224 RepID=A0ABR8YLR3_9MICC|nr:CHAD domain-containing protein [Arthrobacter pullicola]MBD8045172.1 CHAD domain-containing protein [Arthrobacter pullicola]